MNREKIEKLQTDLATKIEDVKKLKNMIISLKNNLARVEKLEKKPK